jgi:microcystin degradation protein MlrC
MRIFAASLATETNTFAPFPTDRRAFEQAFYAPPGKHPETPTLCSAPIVAARRRARAEGHTLIEGTATWAEPAGIVARAAYESLRDEILDQLRAALPVDVVLLGLHGAMVAHGYDDCEGDLMQRARAIAGDDAVLGVELDMHCHLTDAMVEAADAIITFKEFPHIDFADRAEELVSLCLAAARGEVKPVISVYDCRAITGFMTSREPGRGFVDRIKAMEGRDGVLSISIGHGFQAADVRDVGTKVLVITDGDAAAGASLAKKLGEEIIGFRGSGTPRHVKPDEAIAIARGADGRPRPGPIVFADRWDNPGGGVAGDSTFMVALALANPDIPTAIGALWDPTAASFCVAAGPGAVMPLRFGGKAAATGGSPIDADVIVRATTNDLRIPFQDSIVSLGPAACVTIGALDVVLVTGRAQTFHPAVFTELGIDLAAKTMVVVKSSNHFYAAFARIAREIHYLDCGGPYPPDPARIPYTKVRRPIWPLDANPWG